MLWAMEREHKGPVSFPGGSFKSQYVLLCDLFFFPLPEEGTHATELSSSAQVPE